ncbi:metallophosphoesterase, partial [Pseudomonas sp. BGM005]|nr:metallophosphoesterase [Pseudomonas sp. BG5]
GNHDWWEDGTAQKNGGMTFGHRALAHVGIPVYGNRAVRLEKDGRGFWFAGLEDQLALLPGRKWGRTRMLGLDDLDGTMAQVTDDAPVILLAH